VIFPRRAPTRGTRNDLTTGGAAMAEWVRRAKRTPTPFQQARPQPTETPGANQKADSLLMRAQIINAEMDSRQGSLPNGKTRRESSASLQDDTESILRLRPHPEQSAITPPATLTTPLPAIRPRQTTATAKLVSVLAAADRLLGRTCSRNESHGNHGRIQVEGQSLAYHQPVHFQFPQLLLARP